MLQKFLTKISYFDRFGAEVKLNFRKKETHQSPFGGFCTILLVLVLTVIFISGAVGLIKKETFIISSNKILNVDPPITPLHSKDFMMAFQAENFIKQGTKRLFNFIFTSQTQMMDENGNMTKIETQTYKLEQCNISHFVEFDETSIYNKILKDQLDDYYCLPLNYSLYLQGTYKSNIFEYGKISVTICSSDDCYSTQEIQQFQQLGYFDNSFKIIIQNHYYYTITPQCQIESLIQTCQIIIFHIFTLIFIFRQKLDQKLKQIYIQKKSVIPGIKALEEKYVFSIMDNKLQSSSVFIIKSQTYFNYTSNITKVASFFIRLSQSEIHYYKEYYRFDQLFSYVGGISQFLATILGYFILRYNQTGLQIKLANSLYQFDMPEKQKGEMVFSFELLVNKIFESLKSIEDVVAKFKNSAQRIITLSRLAGALKFNNQQSIQNDDIDDEMVNHLAIQQESQNDKSKLEKCIDYSHESNQTFYLEQDKKKFLNLIIQLILESRKKLSFGVHFIAKQVSGSFKKNTTTNYQSQLFEKSRKMILRDMDILVIMNKLQEIEKLKHVIFNKTQRKVFNYLQKPIVCVKEKINSGQYDHSLIQNDLKSKREDTLRQTMSSKSLLGIRQKFNTVKKFKKLYEAYEDLALAEDPDNTEKIMNQRLLKLVEPTIQYSFNSLVEMEKLSRYNQKFKLKKIVLFDLETQVLKPKTFKLGSSHDVEEEIENNQDYESILNGQKKDNLNKRSLQSLPENKFKNLNTLQSSTRQINDIKFNQIQSKQDFLDVEIFSS